MNAPSIHRTHDHGIIAHHAGARVSAGIDPNYITPETVRAGAGCVRAAKVFELSLPLGSTGPQVRGDGVRFNPIHRMTMLPEDIAGPDGLIGTDDIVIMPLQCATQWDSLAHIGYDGRFYNDVDARTAVTAMSGAVRNGIDHTLPGVVGRGVLLDNARLRGVEWILADDDPIISADLDAAAEQQAVEVRTGDALDAIRDFAADDYELAVENTARRALIRLDQRSHTTTWLPSWNDQPQLAATSSRQKRTFPWKWLVKICTMRFRGNAAPWVQAP